MTRPVALRACAFFLLFAAAAVGIGLASGSQVVGAFAVTGAIIALLTAGFASATPQRALVPVRATARRRR